MSKNYDLIIVGAGIVGLATAYQALKANRNIRLALVEKESDVGLHQSGHNSGVIHSGIYYKPGSLKAQNCIRGYQYMINFCKENNIPFDLCGKIIVATSEQELPGLRQLYDRGIANGLKGLTMLDKQQILEKEPHVNGIQGIYVPQTGIIDYVLVCHKLAELISGMGGDILLNKKVTAIQENPENISIFCTEELFTCRFMVNCAGLYSDALTRMVMGNSPVKILPFRGEYYMLKPAKTGLVKNLIYPVPDPSFPFLGVHFTRMINGGVEAGPNAVLAFKKEGYHKTDISWTDLFSYTRFSGFWHIVRKYWRTGFSEMYRSYSKSAFTHSLQKLIPEINSEDLLPGGSGVRAQACDNKGNLIDDFYFADSPRSMHVCNAPSPAATSSLAIGEAIVQRIQEKHPF